MAKKKTADYNREKSLHRMKPAVKTVFRGNKTANIAVAKVLILTV